MNIDPQNLILGIVGDHAPPILVPVGGYGTVQVLGASTGLAEPTPAEDDPIEPIPLRGKLLSPRLKRPGVYF